ncbi:MAG: hypothetical protein RIK87_29290 [Fuerstiella sp.]
MTPYDVQVVDRHGKILSETQVHATSFAKALGHLSEVGSEAANIQVFHPDGSKAGATSVSYWRKNLGRR